VARYDFEGCAPEMAWFLNLNKSSKNFGQIFTLETHSRCWDREINVDIPGIFTIEKFF
jgi:hypothetical protein